MEETQKEQSSEEENKYQKDELVSIFGSPHLTFKIIDITEDELGIYPENKYNYNLHLVEGVFFQHDLPCVPEYLLVKKE
tara:strand:- start:99 stop:335 length:237 start_codon:yes stop_codon:yes gene_type:complete